MSKISEAKTLIEQVRTSQSSAFYKDAWGNIQDPEQLPSIGREEFIATPLSARRYKESRSLVKIVHDGEHAFLSEWAFDDIGREPWGLVSARPMVYLENSHDAIERSLWCYERGMVPLVGEPDADLAMFTAEKYRIDSLIADISSVIKLLPYLEKREEALASLTIVGSEYDASACVPFAGFSRESRFAFALPETGVIALSALVEHAQFTPAEGCIVERVHGVPVITKGTMLVTPLIRYRVPALDLVDVRIDSSL